MKKFPMLQLEMAKLDGFKDISSHANGVDLIGYPRIDGGLCDEPEIIPNYSQDLNAVHSVVRKLSREQQRQANLNLIESMGQKDESGSKALFFASSQLRMTLAPA